MWFNEEEEEFLRCDSCRDFVEFYKDATTLTLRARESEDAKLPNTYIVYAIEDLIVHNPKYEAR